MWGARQWRSVVCVQASPPVVSTRRPSRMRERCSRKNARFKWSYCSSESSWVWVASRSRSRVARRGAVGLRTGRFGGRAIGLVLREAQWSSHAVGAVHGQHARMPSRRTVAAYLAHKVLATILKSGCLRMAVRVAPWL